MYNWLDIVLIIILCITFILGLIRGFVKQIIGILAVVVGLALAIIYYPYVSQIFFSLISHRILSNFLGFLFIFLAVLGLGGLFSHLLSKLIKGPFKFFDRVLGGVLGTLKGVLICVIIVFALLVFPINKNWLRKSQLTPYCLKVSQAIIHLIPQELKEEFWEKYKEILGKVEKNGEKV